MRQAAYWKIVQESLKRKFKGSTKKIQENYPSKIKSLIRTCPPKIIISHALPPPHVTTATLTTTPK
jgi:hypothetical protein